MAHLVAVCREGEEDYPFLARQIPLYVDDSLTVRLQVDDGQREVIAVVVQAHNYHV